MSAHVSYKWHAGFFEDDSWSHLGGYEGSGMPPNAVARQIMTSVDARPPVRVTVGNDIVFDWYETGWRLKSSIPRDERKVHYAGTLF